MTKETVAENTTMMHTPGPWTATRGECEGKPESWFDVTAPWPECGPDERQNIAMIYGRDPVEANARLIAAAPDLLAALKAITDPAYGNPGYPEENKQIEAQAEAAIAKAEGRS